MALTYTVIADTLVGSGGANSILFDNIPQTYTDLVILSSCRGSQTGQANDGNIRLNGATTNRGGTFWETNSVDKYGGSGSTIKLIDVGNGASSNLFSSIYIIIPNYALTDRFKNVLTENVTENFSNNNSWQMFQSGLWSSTSAVTSVTLIPDSGTYLQHSRATLYGIKNTV
jgi:hypothetical protein